MKDRYGISALKALAVAVALTLILAFATGSFSLNVAIVGVIVFAVAWVILVGRRPKGYEASPEQQAKGSS